MRKMTTIRIDAKILKKAQELGINISKACENALKLYIQALENANKQIVSNQALNEERNKEWCSGRDLNPRIRPQLTDGTRVCGSRGRHT